MLRKERVIALQNIGRVLPIQTGKLGRMLGIELLGGVELGLLQVGIRVVERETRILALINKTNSVDLSDIMIRRVVEELRLAPL